MLSRSGSSSGRTLWAEPSRIRNVRQIFYDGPVKPSLPNGWYPLSGHCTPANERCTDPYRLSPPQTILRFPVSEKSSQRQESQPNDTHHRALEPHHPRRNGCSSIAGLRLHPDTGTGTGALTGSSRRAGARRSSRRRPATASRSPSRLSLTDIQTHGRRGVRLRARRERVAADAIRDLLGLCTIRSVSVAIPLSPLPTSDRQRSDVTYSSNPSPCTCSYTGRRWRRRGCSRRPWCTGSSCR